VNLNMFSHVQFMCIVLLLLCVRNAAAQSVKEQKEFAVIELGGAAFRRVTGDAANSFGPSIAIELTPVKNWLELEIGTTVLFRRHSTEWGTDLLLKKPWALSPKVEFMLGIGPEWNHSKEFGVTTNSVSCEAVGDFMFWPSLKHRFGWYLEPTYEYNFARGHEQSVGITAGLLISIP
jgi:hypothetical protein